MAQDLSIVIAIYNQASYIMAVLDSIAILKGIKPEIIVVDDASTDGSGQLAAEWAKDNPGINIKILRLSGRKFGLEARITGVKASTCPEIMFMDADDCLLGHNRLTRVLNKKIECGADIAHFCTRVIDLKGNLLGEALFDLPLSNGLILRDELLAAYTDRSWPPGEVWGKIYSRELLLKIIPWIENKSIYRLDTVICLLTMFAASSYLGCREIIYEHKVSEYWPMQKYAQRLHDMAIISSCLQEMSLALGIPEKYLSAYRKNFGLFFSAWNAGKLSNDYVTALEAGENAQKLSADLENNIDLDTLLAQTLYSTKMNADRVYNCHHRIMYEF